MNNPNILTLSLPNGNTATNPDSATNNNPSQQNSNVNPNNPLTFQASLLQSTPVSGISFRINQSENFPILILIENNNSSSVLAQRGEIPRTVRETQIRNEFGNATFIARGQKVGLIAARRTGRVRGNVIPPERQHSYQSFEGTVDYIGQSHVHLLQEEGEPVANKRQFKFCCITGTIKGQGLDEMRAKDHFNMKNNLIPPEKKQLLDAKIADNIFRRDQGDNQFLQSSFNSTLGGGIGMNNNNLLMPDQSVQNVIQESEKITQTTTSTQQIQHKKTAPKKSVQPVQEVIAVEAQQTVISSNPGSFGYEMNKLLFFSGLSQAMEKHNLTVPGNVLDETDFVAKFVEFFGQYNINLPTENVPQFELNSFTPLMKK